VESSTQCLNTSLSSKEHKLQLGLIIIAREADCPFPYMPDSQLLELTENEGQNFPPNKDLSE
jgi:hypothetical protein